MSDRSSEPLRPGGPSAPVSLDVLVWTGGVGEHAPAIRVRSALGLGFLGVRIDEGRNQTATGDCDLTAAGATVGAVVVSAREDLEIARQVRGVLG